MSLLLKPAAELLEKSGIHRPQWTAEQLLSHHLDCRPVELYLDSPEISSEQAIRFQADVAARANGVPLQYLQGSAGFYGREFLVGPGVFIPRPETEILVETVLGVIASDQRELSNLVLADIGTGSGAIAVTLALESPGLRIYAIDQSPLALSFSRRNSARHGCSVSFLQGNCATPLSPGSVDLITANLPYLDPTEALLWPPELAWEPWLALDGGRGGTALIETLIQQAYPVLRPNGKLILEIGLGQLEQISSFAQSHLFRVKEVVKDLAGLERVVVLWRN